MNQNFNIPEEIAKEVSSFFPTHQISYVLGLMDTFPVQISFIKESCDENNSILITSGIIKSGSGIECRFTLKKEKGHPKGLSSSCSCVDWTKNDHCQHVLLLLLKVTLQNKKASSSGNHQFSTLQNQLTNICSPKEYGTLITQNNGFEQTSGNSYHFQNLHYLLKNGQSVHFQNPKFLSNHDQIIINLKTKIINEDFESRVIAVPYFKYVINNEIKESISFFDIFYIFDWENGNVYHTPQEVKEFISKVLKLNQYFSVDEYLNFFLFFCHKIKFEIQINDQLLILPSNNQFKEIHINIGHSAGEKNTFLNISFKTQDEQTIQTPFISNIFCLKGELLSAFTKKNYASNFIEKLFYAISHEQKGQILGPEVRYSKKRNILDLYVSLLLDPQNNLIYGFDIIQNQINAYCPKEIKELFLKFFLFYGKLIFSYSEITNNNQSIQMMIPTLNFYEKLPEFYESLTEMGNILFFIRKNKISRFKKTFSFTRSSAQTDWFDLSIALTEDDYHFLNGIDESNQIYNLKDRTVILTKSQLQLLKFFKRNSDFKNFKKDDDGQYQVQIQIKKHNIFELFALHQEGILPALYDDEILFCKKISSLDQLPEVILPQIKDNNLRNYQIDGLKWMSFLYNHGLGHCLADDMGLGKTLQTITLIESIYHKKPKILIVCPVSILIIWKNEFEKFSSLPVRLYYGHDRTIESDDEQSILITSYGILKNELLTTFADKQFDLIIFDEAQNFKNPKSKATFAAKTIKGHVKITLTGTPLENDLSEFYNILDVSLPGIWGQYIKLKKRNEADLIGISKKIASPFILRRTKLQVLHDLPPKNEQTLNLIFSEEESQFYQKELLKIKNKIIERKGQLQSGEVLNDILYLRKLCLWQKKAAGHDPLSTKIDFLKETIIQIVKEGHKTIIFSQFTEYLDLIEKQFRILKISYARFDGTYSLKKREKEIERFEKEVPIILISLKAGGTGLNLNMASYVFILDPWWNPAVEEQAIDRAYRLGKQFPLTVYRLVIKDSIEEKIIQLQKSKKDLFNQVLADGESSSNFKFDLKDLEKILFS